MSPAGTTPHKKTSLASVLDVACYMACKWHKINLKYFYYKYLGLCWTGNDHSPITVNKMNNSTEGHSWYSCEPTEKPGYCSVSPRVFVDACTQMVWWKGGEWFHVFICKINLSSKLAENQNIVNSDSFVERKKEQQEKWKKIQEWKSKLCRLTPLVQEPFQLEHYQNCCAGTSQRRIQLILLPFWVHTPNVSKNIPEDARCDFEW